MRRCPHPRRSQSCHLGFRDILSPALDGADDVGRLATPLGSMRNAIRMILVGNLTGALPRVAHQAQQMQPGSSPSPEYRGFAS